MPASRALSGQGEPKGMTATPPFLLTGSTAETPLPDLQTGAAAAWTEITPTATAAAQAPSSVKGPSLRRDWGPAVLP